MASDTPPLHRVNLEVNTRQTSYYSHSEWAPFQQSDTRLYGKRQQTIRRRCVTLTGDAVVKTTCKYLIRPPGGYEIGRSPIHLLRFIRWTNVRYAIQNKNTDGIHMFTIILTVTTVHCRRSALEDISEFSPTTESSRCN